MTVKISCMPNFAIGMVVKVLIEKRSYTSVSVLKLFKDIVSLFSGMSRQKKGVWVEKAKTYGQTDKLTNVKTFF